MLQLLGWRVASRAVDRAACTSADQTHSVKVANIDQVRSQQVSMLDKLAGSSHARMVEVQSRCAALRVELLCQDNKKSCIIMSLAV